MYSDSFARSAWTRAISARMSAGFILAATIALLGCAPEGIESKRPGQVDAERIVWVETFHERLSSLPSVEWRGIGECGDGTGFADGDTCRWDLMHLDTWTSETAWNGSFSKSAFSHSLCHAHAYLQGDPTGDFNHAGECFVGGLSNVADEALRAHGR